MMARPRWEYCIANHGDEVIAFADAYFKNDQRQCLLIGGAGFDPRCLTFATILGKGLDGRLRGVLLPDRRPYPPLEFVNQADQNVTALRSIMSELSVIDIEVLADDDDAVIGGRRATAAVACI